MPSFIPELARHASGALAVAVLAVGVAPAAHASGVPGQGTWETTLQGRDLDGNTATFEAYYDTALNITWLADANYAKTSNYPAANSSGQMTWDEAASWADNLVVGAYSDWRLPTMVDTGTSGCDYSNFGDTDCGSNVQTRDASTGVVYSEMAHLYYVILGNKTYCAPGNAGCFTVQPDWGLKNTGPFSNVQSVGPYWFGVEYAPSAYNVWGFGIEGGGQYYSNKGEELSAWAVHPGDVAAAVVPEPSSYALMGLGLATVLLARKRRA